MYTKMGGNLTIRAARPDDAAAIFGVHESNGDTEPWADAEDLRRWVEWVDRVEGARTIVAERGGQVVGVGELWWGRDVAPIGRSLDMSMLYVHRGPMRWARSGFRRHPSRRERGCGRSGFSIRINIGTCSAGRRRTRLDGL